MLPNVSIRLFSVPGVPFSSLRTVFSVLPLLLWGHAALSGKGACPAGLFSKWRWNLIAKIPSQGHSFVIQEICGFERRSWKGCPDGLAQSLSSQHNSISAASPVSWMGKDSRRHNSITVQHTVGDTSWDRDTMLVGKKYEGLCSRRISKNGVTSVQYGLGLLNELFPT